MARSKGSHMSTLFFELNLGVRASRCFLKAFGSGGTTKVVALARLEGIPLLGGIVSLVHLELIIVLAQFVATSILADFGATSLVASIVPAIRDLGNIGDLGVSTVVLL